MIEIRETEIYKKWFKALKDREARARILARLRRISLGNFGEVRPVGKGVSEIIVDYGPGYRIYFAQKKETIVILLCGGNKSTQDKDIKLAHEMAYSI